ncbi:MAG: hypothetical protein HYX52_06345 [Chloroflexi bacterium]|nr:hypothetical protein [Chloroflexota bacterium]
MVFFYEILFTLVAIAAAVIGEVWSRTLAVLFLAAWLGLISLGYASFGARLQAAEGLSDDDVLWYHNARDGLRHLRLLFGIALAVAVLWRLLAG